MKSDLIKEFNNLKKKSEYWEKEETPQTFNRTISKNKGKKKVDFQWKVLPLKWELKNKKYG